LDKGGQHSLFPFLLFFQTIFLTHYLPAAYRVKKPGQTTAPDSKKGGKYANLKK
jgi:hypothetical protein